MALPLATQPTNGHDSQPLSGLQTINLGGIEGQAGQGGAPEHGSEIASPVLLLQPPAFFEFAEGIIVG